jgi:hypothetical protein
LVDTTAERDNSLAAQLFCRLCKRATAEVAEDRKRMSEGEALMR